MSRFSDGINDDDKETKESRVSANLTTKKEPMVTRSIRISERDMLLLEDYFKGDDRTFTQGVRMILKDYIKSKGL